MAEMTREEVTRELEAIRRHYTGRLALWPDNERPDRDEVQFLHRRIVALDAVLAERREKDGV